MTTGDEPAAAGYRVRRSDRARRARLVVDEQGMATVVLPRRAPLAAAAGLVEAHAAWLARHQAVALDVARRLAERPALADGRVLQVHGQPLRILAIDAGPRRPARGRVEIVPGGLDVHLGRDDRSAVALAEARLRRAARDAIGADVARRSPALAVRPGRITMRDQSTRWASASASGALSFSWRLVLVPPFVLDAVVVHELAHLRVRGHGRRFWALVEQHAPRTAEARAWLRAHAREVRAALD